jgi:hypothetical protein
VPSEGPGWQKGRSPSPGSSTIFPGRGAVNRSGPFGLADLPRAAAPPSSGPLGGPPTTDPPPHDRKPTSKQLRYLRSLAESRGESFAYPATRAQASAEIERLKARRRSPRGDRRREVAEVRRAMATRGDAAAVRSSELGGYGSSATWR